jgi:hypothetical protein
VTVSGYGVVGQAFGVCDVLSEDWPNDPADGVLGLGQFDVDLQFMRVRSQKSSVAHANFMVLNRLAAFESIATSHKKPWFYNAISQNQKLNSTLESEMFSFAMGR